VPPPHVVPRTKAVRNECNLKKQTLALVRDDSEEPARYRLAFTFDTTAECMVTVYFMASEMQRRGQTPSYYSVVPELKPISERRECGLGQSFVTPAEHALDLTRFSDAMLRPKPQRKGEPERFPIVICLESLSSANGGNVSSQTTFASLSRPSVEGAPYVVEVVRQKIQVGNASYELQEIYGVVDRPGADASGGDDADSGAECVICMTERKDITVLPCRHMCMCANCARALRLQSNKCPICRQPIQSLLQIKTSAGSSQAT
jgi:hypothetical protein